jgi:hypothetical protein
MSTPILSIVCLHKCKTPVNHVEPKREAFTASKVNKNFSGYQPCQWLNITDDSRAISAQMDRICIMSDPDDMETDVPWNVWDF